jgi:hypothetical protein
LRLGGRKNISRKGAKAQRKEFLLQLLENRSREKGVGKFLEVKGSNKNENTNTGK